MKRRRDRNCDKEFTDVQKLKAENKALKRHITRLRKQIIKADLERTEINSLLEREELLAKEEEKKKINKELEKKWQCHKCSHGVLKLYLIQRRDGVFYYRKCICGNRTTTKKYHDKVDGIRDD